MSETLKRLREMCLQIETEISNNKDTKKIFYLNNKNCSKKNGNYILILSLFILTLVIKVLKSHYIITSITVLFMYFIFTIFF